MAGIFKCVRLSTIRFIKLAADGSGLKYIDWDENADITKPPDGDLIGLHGFAVSTSGKLHDFQFGVTCQTLNDPNLFRLTDIVDKLYNLMLPEKQFSIIHPNTGEVIAAASFAGETAVHPVNRIETRVTISLQARFVVNLAQ